MKFEDKIKLIEEIVNSLENKELSMDDMLSKYEQGTLLVNECREYINQAEQKFININEKFNDNQVI
ncbi:MAG TPA: exodeoxyribonuclease VII small subunit [Candidatus Kapabacteria bacterium]|nr:exodeoxyribonuclease VII small subunit [Candidatus Kapabacteria bacterium]